MSDVHTVLLELEDDGWRALSTGADEARRFYGEVLDDDVVMLFPDGTMMTGRKAVLESLDVEPWGWYRIDDVRVVQLAEDAAIVAYRATAQRGDAPEYRALVSSAYTRRSGSWRLALHQQTPI